MLLLDLRKNQQLEAKRHPMFEKNKFGKFYLYFMAVFWAAYLILIGSGLAAVFQNIFPSMEPYHIMNKGLIYLFLADFLLRFIFQKTPTQEIKPYLLLPIHKKKILHCLLLKSATSSYNLLWLLMFVPFSIVTITPIYGFTGVILYALTIWLLAVLNSYWYLLCRTLINEKIGYVLVPIIVYGLLAAAEFTLDNPISSCTMNVGEAFIEGRILYFLALMLAIFVLAIANRSLMIRNLYAELAKSNDVKVKNISEYSFLERYGEIGEYARLELKLLFRNKRTKSQFSLACILIVMLTSMLFTKAYEGAVGKSFVCIYNFAVIGLMMLSQIMSYEGSYLDGLMSRKESIYNLLKAKYYFYSACLIVPFILMIPAIALGKVSFFTCLSYGFFTTGFVYFITFQLAVYNNKTTPLNESMMGRQFSGTGFQNLVSLCTFGIPLLLSYTLRTMFGEETSLWIILGIGLVLTFTSNLWIKNIYHRFMKRRYQNMEGFRDTK